MTCPGYYLPWWQFDRTKWNLGKGKIRLIQPSSLWYVGGSGRSSRGNVMIVLCSQCFACLLLWFCLPPSHLQKYIFHTLFLHSAVLCLEVGCVWVAVVTSLLQRRLLLSSSATLKTPTSFRTLQYFNITLQLADWVTCTTLQLKNYQSLFLILTFAMNTKWPNKGWDISR